jgi:hypothetical protein
LRPNLNDVLVRTLEGRLIARGSADARLPKVRENKEKNLFGRSHSRPNFRSLHTVSDTRTLLLLRGV